MEKILVVFPAQKVNLPFIDFACYLSQEVGSKLTGVFIENPYEPRIETSDLELDLFAESTVNEINSAVRPAATLLEQNISLFRTRCREKGVASEVYKDHGEPVQEVLEESRYADLIIVDPKTDYYGEEEGFLSHFVKNLLTNAACPIVLAPESFEAVEELVFCYDGSDSSLFAIKQFTYLFPYLKNQKVTLLEVQPPNKANPPEGHTRIIQWIQTHYQNFVYKKLEGGVENELFMYLFGQRNKFVVMGAYGRSMLSNFFHQSDANILIRSVDLPLFITHY